MQQKDKAAQRRQAFCDNNVTLIINTCINWLTVYIQDTVKLLSISYAMHKLYKLYWSGNKIRDKKTSGFQEIIAQEGRGIVFLRGWGWGTTKAFHA